MRPYSYQTDCLSALATARQGGSKRDLVVMATGLGKTMVAAFDIKRLLEEAPGRVLYLCHQNQILAQARKTFEKVLGRGRSYGNFHGTEKHLHSVDILFASFQTMANWREAFLRDEFRYVVVDEVHHAQAETFRPTVQHFTPDFMLGLTATVKRADGLDVGELFNGNPVFELDLYEALARGYLCDVDYRIMTDEIQAAGVLDTPVGKLSIARLNRTIFIPKRDEEIARVIAEKTAHIQNPRVMVFCSSIRHAENMAALVPGAEVVHSKLKSKEKDSRLAAFRSGMTTTVTTIDMFNEGIDVPEANVIVFLRSTASETIYLQQFGRGLRKADGKDSVLVLDFVANCERIVMVRELDARVRQFREEMAQEAAVAASPEVTDNSELHSPLILTLDGVEFDERTWRLLDLIKEVRAKPQSYTREQLIEQLRRKAKELGRSPKRREVDADSGMASAPTFSSCFGSYNKALGAAGLSPTRARVLRPKSTRGWSERELVMYLIQLSRMGRVTKEVIEEAWRMDDDRPSLRTLIDQFGSVTNALKAASLPTKATYTPDELLEQLRGLHVELGRTPTQADIVAACKLGKCGSRQSFLRAFGSLEVAFTQADVGQTRRKRYTQDELLDYLKAWHEEHGKVPSYTDITKACAKGLGPSTSPFIEQFGSWSGALRRLNMTSRHMPLPDADLLVPLQDFQSKTSEPVRIEDVNRLAREGHLPRSAATYVRRFGNWAEVQRLAAKNGSPGSLGMDITNEATEVMKRSPADLLAQVLIKAKSLGRPPRAGEVDADSAMASAKEIKSVLRASTWAEVISYIKPHL